MNRPFSWLRTFLTLIRLVDITGGVIRLKTFFSDQKSRGFHIHKSHLSDPARLSRLLIAACLAYIWMIVQGLWVIENRKTELIDRKDRTDKSVFRLGLDWFSLCFETQH